MTRTTWVLLRLFLHSNHSANLHSQLGFAKLAKFGKSSDYFILKHALSINFINTTVFRQNFSHSHHIKDHLTKCIMDLTSKFNKLISALISPDPDPHSFLTLETDFSLVDFQRLNLTQYRNNVWGNDKNAEVMLSSSLYLFTLFSIYII